VTAVAGVLARPTVKECLLPPLSVHLNALEGSLGLHATRHASTDFLVRIVD